MSETESLLGLNQTFLLDWNVKYIALLTGEVKLQTKKLFGIALISTQCTDELKESPSPKVWWVLSAFGHGKKCSFSQVSVTGPEETASSDTRAGQTGKFTHPKGFQALAQAAEGSGEPLFLEVFKKHGCAIWVHGLVVGLAVLDSCLNSRILEGFSNINDPMIPHLNHHKISRKSLPVHGGNACFRGCFVERKDFMPCISNLSKSAEPWGHEIRELFRSVLSLWLGLLWHQHSRWQGVQERQHKDPQLNSQKLIHSKSDVQRRAAWKAGTAQHVATSA